MFDIYDYMERCREEGMSGEEALHELSRDLAEHRANLIEELEERQLATAWQQDLIDMYRMER